MKRNLLVAMMAITALTVVLGRSAANAQNRPYRPLGTNDEEALKKLVHEWAMSTVQGNLQDLEKIMVDNFSGDADGIRFNKKMLLEAIRSGQMKVGDWTIDEVRVSIRGNSASATGRSTLTKATYMNKDFSGNWLWTDRFVKQREGNWRAVSSQSKRIKQ
jgi:hypothetical protein